MCAIVRMLTLTRPNPPFPELPFDGQVVLGFWKEFNLDGRRLQLDKQVRGVGG